MPIYDASGEEVEARDVLDDQELAEVNRIRRLKRPPSSRSAQGDKNSYGHHRLVVPPDPWRQDD